jgi:hypothetical protein
METTAKHKRGNVREDGMVFWAYDKKAPNGEKWITQERFNIKKSTRRIAWHLAKKPKGELKMGYKREDGMIFLRYSNISKNGMRWVTVEKYKKIKDKKRIKDSKKYRENLDVREKYKKYALANKRKIRIRMKLYQQNRVKTDLLFKLGRNIRVLIRCSFKNKNLKKNTKTESILGCSIIEFKKHIELQFLDGMSWENRKLWHIDHIIPIVLAKNERQLIQLNHYKNLRPLWAKDNLVKSARYEGEIPEWLK